MSLRSSYYEVMNLIGKGLSVQTICDRAGLTFDELCEVCAEHTDLEIELKKWFPKYDFTVKVTKNDTKEVKDDVSSGQQVSRKPKGKAK